MVKVLDMEMIPLRLIIKHFELCSEQHSLQFAFGVPVCFSEKNIASAASGAASTAVSAGDAAASAGGAAVSAGGAAAASAAGGSAAAEATLLRPRDEESVSFLAVRRPLSGLLEFKHFLDDMWLLYDPEWLKLEILQAKN